MSYFYGYGRRHLERYGNLEKKVAEIEKKLKNLSTDSDPFKTVFEINLKTATKTTDGTKCLEARNGNYVLSQDDKNLAPTFGSNYIENTGPNYMVFCCPELQFGNVSIFVVSETPDTSGPGTWRYIIGNDDGKYDKYIGYKAYSYSKIIHGGSTNDARYTEVTLPTRFNIQHNKNLLSCHWFQTGSCLYGNGSLLAGSEFTANLKHIGAPFGSVFFNERFGNSSITSHDNLKGKIFGFKIVQGLLLPSDIVKIHTEMIKEYGVDI